MSGRNVITRMARAIWNGPFAAGPLVRPVTVGDAIAKVFETFWRFTVLLAFLWIVVGGAILIASASDEIISRNNQSKSEDLTLTVQSTGQVCKDPYPLAVLVKNNSRNTVRGVHFNIEARIPNHSTNLVAPGDYSDDYILTPGATIQACWKLPTFTDVEAMPTWSTLSWTATTTWVEWADSP